MIWAILQMYNSLLRKILWQDDKLLSCRRRVEYIGNRKIDVSRVLRAPSGDLINYYSSRRKWKLASTLVVVVSRDNQRHAPHTSVCWNLSLSLSFRQKEPRFPPNGELSFAYGVMWNNVVWRLRRYIAKFVVHEENVFQSTLRSLIIFLSLRQTY